MRKLLMIWLAFCMLLSVQAIASSALAAELEAEQPAEEGGMVFVPSIEAFRYAEVVTEKGSLNMRAEAKDKAEVLERLQRGTLVRILEDLDEWTRILYKGQTGFVKTSFLKEFIELPYPYITREDEGEAVLAFKRKLHKLGYLKSEDINKRFDTAMVNALIKLQLMNNANLNPEAVTPQLQALIEWGMIDEGKSGYIDTATDEGSGLAVSIFCWDTGGILFEEDRAVRVTICFAAQATGGRPPYTITVKKSLGSGGAQYGDEVTSPFSHIWTQSTEAVYLYATVVDSAGNTVTACTPFRYTMPERYLKK